MILFEQIQELQKKMLLKPKQTDTKLFIMTGEAF